MLELNISSLLLCWYCVDNFYSWKDTVGKKVPKLRSIAELRAFAGNFLFSSLSGVLPLAPQSRGCRESSHRCRSRNADSPGLDPTWDSIASYSSRKAVLGIRIHIFYGLLDPDSLVRGTDPDIKKYLDSYCAVTSLWLFILDKWCKCTF